MARVAVSVQTIALLVTWKWTASVSTRNTSTKKSNASRVQPRKLAVTACHWPVRAGGGAAGLWLGVIPTGFSDVETMNRYSWPHSEGCPKDVTSEHDWDEDVNRSQKLPHIL